MKRLFVKFQKIVFDIIYSLKKLFWVNCVKPKIQYMNGLKMNTLQAKEALNIVFKNLTNNNHKNLLIINEI